VSKTRSFLRLRLLSPLGRYPDRSISVGGARLLIRDDLAVSIVPTESQELHGVTEEGFSELEFLALEEIRFLTSITLSIRPDHGMIYPYPNPLHVDLDTADFGEDWIFENACKYVRSIRYESFISQGVVFPPLVGGPPYVQHESPIDELLLKELIGAVSLQDHLLMRGLGALLKANMLWQRPEFGEAATMMLHVSLEASCQLVLRALRKKGIINPSAFDPGAFIDEVFNPGTRTGAYFAEYYEDRIKALHPSSRFGVFAFAPLAADGFYDLQHDLVAVYVFLIAGLAWPDLWQG
jgi:hypothetical protein